MGSKELNNTEKEANPKKDIDTLIKNAFEMFEKKGTGTVTKADLRRGFQLLGHNPTVQQVEDIMSELGVTGDIDYTGFHRCMKVLATEDCLQGEKELREAFSVFDKDGNGHIDRKELAMALKELGEHFTDKQIDDMFCLADCDSTGKIEYNEFIKILTQ